VPGNQNFNERNNSLLANARLTDTTSKAESGFIPSRKCVPQNCMVLNALIFDIIVMVAMQGAN